MNIIRKMTDHLADTVCDFRESDKNTREVLKYGLYMLIADTIKFFIIIVLALLFKILPYALFSILCFGILRVFAGGVHAKTWLGCFISSGVIFFGVTYSSMFINLGFYSMLAFRAVIYLFCFAAIWAYAPADHENKPIVNARQKKRLKKIAFVTLHILIAVSFVLPQPYSNIAVLSALAECIFILPVTYKITNNRYGCDYKYETQ